MPKTYHPFPAAPLVALLVEYEDAPSDRITDSSTPSLREAAERLEVSYRTLVRYRQPGFALSPLQADKVATRLDLSPALIWPEEWAEFLAADDPDWRSTVPSSPAVAVPTVPECL